MKKQRPDLARHQPSLGETLANAGIQAGTGLIGKWLDGRKGSKALALILEKLRELDNWTLSLDEDLAERHHIMLAGFDALDTRLTAIETALKEREEYEMQKAEHLAKQNKRGEA